MPEGTQAQFRVGAMTCSVSQVGDREWWCSTHRHNAEDCETASETAVQSCDPYCDKHPICRLLNNQPIHYFDCDRFQTYGYGLRQGTCDCTATADVNEILGVPNGT